MSKDNVEIVQRMVDAWNRRDLEAMFVLADAGIQYVNAPTAVEPGTRHGHDGLAAVVRAQWEFASDAHMEIEQIFDRGEEIIFLLHLSRRMPGSDYSVETQGLMSCTIDNGKVIRMELLAGGPNEVREALESAGLTD